MGRVFTCLTKTVNIEKERIMVQNINFERKFSGNYYKNLKIRLAEMIFTNKPLKTARGDIYPTLI